MATKRVHKIRIRVSTPFSATPGPKTPSRPSSISLDLLKTPQDLPKPTQDAPDPPVPHIIVGTGESVRARTRVILGYPEHCGRVSERPTARVAALPLPRDQRKTDRRDSVGKTRPVEVRAVPIQAEIVVHGAGSFPSKSAPRMRIVAVQVVGARHLMSSPGPRRRHREVLPESL